MKHNRLTHIVLLFSVIFLLVGCAVKQPTFQDSQDRLEGYNRVAFVFNEKFDSMTLKPAANLYQSAVPEVVKERISNVFSNLDDVPNAVNNLLQGNIVGSANDVVRLLVNSTLGVAGMFNVASKMGFPKHEEDFSQTLAAWGVGSGSYFVIPILGPSTLRGFPSRLVDYLLNPLSYIGSTGFSLYVLKSVHYRANLLAQEEIIRSWSPDFYVALRNYYLSRRAFLTGETVGSFTEDLYKELD